MGRGKGKARALDALPGTNTNIFMPTTIHIPDALLERVDTRAKTLGISRNRLILEALEEKVGARDEWAPELVHMLASPVAPAAGKELEESLAVVRGRRSSRKGPPKL
jgi:predicted transcriptional regulator